MPGSEKRTQRRVAITIEIVTPKLTTEDDVLFEVEAKLKNLPGEWKLESVRVAGSSLTVPWRNRDPLPVP